RGFGRKHDTILWYARSADWAFYADAVRVARRGGSHMRVVDGVQEKTDRRTGRVYRYPIAGGKVPEDWWTDVETLNHSDRERTGWPSQKPERLVERTRRCPRGGRPRGRRVRGAGDHGSSCPAAGSRLRGGRPRARRDRPLRCPSHPAGAAAGCRGRAAC